MRHPLAQLLLLVACAAPLAAAQVTASGADDAAALREARAAADTSACIGLPFDAEGTFDKIGQASRECPLDSWGAATEPCGDGYDDRNGGWVGVMCDARDGRVVVVTLYETAAAGELLPFFGRLGALLVLELDDNTGLSGDVADLATAAQLRFLDLSGCPLVRGEAQSLTSLAQLGENFTRPGCPRSGCPRSGGLWLRGSGVRGSAAPLRALPGLGPDWYGFESCSFLRSDSCLVTESTRSLRVGAAIFVLVLLALALRWPVSALLAKIRGAPGAAETDKRGTLSKLSGKQRDSWRPVEVELNATDGLSWTSGSASRDRMAGSQKMLAPHQMLSVAIWSEIGIEHAFEVVSSVKNGKVYKLKTESEEECDGWIAAIDSVISQGPATEITRNPSSSDAAPSPFELEPEPGQHGAGGAAAPFEMEGLGARLVAEPEPDR